MHLVRWFMLLFSRNFWQNTNRKMSKPFTLVLQQVLYSYLKRSFSVVHVRRRARPGAVNRARNTRARHGESIVHLDTGASRPPDRRRETPLHSFELLRLSVLELHQRPVCVVRATAKRGLNVESVGEKETRRRGAGARGALRCRGRSRAPLFYHQKHKQCKEMKVKASSRSSTAGSLQKVSLTSNDWSFNISLIRSAFILAGLIICQ